MKTVNIHEAKTRFSALLAEIEEHGAEILICRNGKPVADLIPHRPRKRLQPHPVMKKIQIDYDVTEPLADDEWPEGSR
jgi:prevent-host-death family protein